MNKKKNFLILGIIVFLCILVLPVSYFLRRISKNRMMSYNETFNDAGLSDDVDNNPYFHRQPGYSYKFTKTIKYMSSVTGTERKARVFLPVGYSDDKQYPVLYLLHGYGGGRNTWRNKNAQVIIQNLYYFKNVPEMIVVCPDCVVGTDVDSDISFYESIKYFDLTERELIDSLMPYVEENFPVKTGRSNTAIAGNSMGGRNALAIAFNNQDRFGYVGAFSPVSPVYLENHSGIPSLTDELKIDEETGQFKYFLLCVGRSDPKCGDITYYLHDYLNGNNVRHEFYDVEGGHENKVWQNALYNFVQHIFTE